jgi:hypothetical protein
MLHPDGSSILYKPQVCSIDESKLHRLGFNSNFSHPRPWLSAPPGPLFSLPSLGTDTLMLNIAGVATAVPRTHLSRHLGNTDTIIGIRRNECNKTCAIQAILKGFLVTYRQVALSLQLQRPPATTTLCNDVSLHMIF